jgi:uncharacterized protein YndB with AHSA1/START domain
MMVASDTETTAASDREIVTTRVIDAPRERVFDAWTAPEHVARWWGPNGFTLTIHEMDVRPGGAWRFIMHGPDGANYDNEIVYVEVERPERIVYDHVSRPRFRSTTTFEDDGGKTRLTMRGLFETVTDYEIAVHQFGAIEGAKQHVARLAEHVTGGATSDEPDLVFTRVLDVPRELVWKAWTEAERFARWFGPRGFTCPVCEVDARPGGAVRLVMRSPDGVDYPGGGYFDEVVEPERLVFVSTADGADGTPMLVVRNTLTLEEQADNRTLLTLNVHVVTATAEAGDALSGMEEGWRQTIERLAAFVGAST